jgi:hypothetical protein
VRRRREEEVVERGGAREHREAGGTGGELDGGAWSLQPGGMGEGEGRGRREGDERVASRRRTLSAGGLYQVFLPGVLGCRISNFEFSDDV